MKSRITFATAIVVGLMISGAVSVFRQPLTVKAQDDVNPRIPVPKDRSHITSGLVGFTHGQTMRINVTNTDPAACPCQRLHLYFRNWDGSVFHDHDFKIVQQTVELWPNWSASLELNYDDYAFDLETRAEFRAIVDVLPPPAADMKGAPPPNGDHLVTTLEVFNNDTNRTQVAIYGMVIER